MISLDLIYFNATAELEIKQYLATKGYQHVHGNREPVVFVTENF